jgi:uncharacterized protein (TIGR04222 family)
MDWLTNNPIAQMPGPGFLALYAAVIGLVAFFLWWRVRQLDTSGALPPRLVPTNPDPYESAYLRGGENELTRVLLFDLIERGYLKVGVPARSWWQGKAEPRIERGDRSANVQGLNAVERGVLEWFAEPRSAREVFGSNSLSWSLEPVRQKYEQRMREEQLLWPAEAQPAERRMFGGALALLLGLGGYKFALVIWSGQMDGLILVIPALVGMAILSKVGLPPRLSHRGRAFLKQLQGAYQYLRHEMPSARSGRAGANALLPVGLFGVGVLAGSDFSDYERMFHRSAASGGSCGGSCGSGGGDGGSGDGGGGCGGGCGGGGD